MSSRLDYLSYQIVPATEDEDINKDVTTWRDGKLVAMNISESKCVIYLNHQLEEVEDENGNTSVVVRAWAVEVARPIKRDDCINSAEMTAYNLRSAMEVASFNSALARKAREDSEDEEVAEHDKFVSVVKEWLDVIGIYDSSDTTDLERAKAKKLSEIKAYDSSDNVNSVTLNGVKLWLNAESRARIKMRLESENALGKESTTLWYGEIGFTLNVAQAMQMLYALESYASTCYDVTQRHKNAVAEMSSVDEVNAYDYTTGYPDKLSF